MPNQYQIKRSAGRIFPDFLRIPARTNGNSSIGAISCIVMLGAAMALACSSEPPVVERGRYVELATDRDEPVCGGTVAYMDHYVSEVAALLGEALPDRVFIRYEWNHEERGLTSERRNHWLIQSNVLPVEHELVHAVHFQVWPASRPFLHEGLAALLDSGGFARAPWPEGQPLDLLLEAESREVDYQDALFVVSQIVRDHGFEGLRELWQSVPHDASPQQVRNAYQAVFDRPMDALFEPIDGVPRQTCHFTVCVGEATPWDGDAAALEGPSDCARDPNAVGPTTDRLFGSVWRPHVVDLEDTEHRWESTGGASAILRWCRLRCEPNDPMPYTSVAADGSFVEDLGLGPMRVEVTHPLEDLPRDEPGSVRISAEW